MLNTFSKMAAGGAVAFSMLVSMPASALVIDSNFQGWVDQYGDGNGAIANNDTFTGSWRDPLTFSKAKYNSWANFNLSGIASPVISAKHSRSPQHEPDRHGHDRVQARRRGSPTAS